MADLLIAMNPFRDTPPQGADLLAWVNRPRPALMIPPLQSCFSDGEGHVSITIRPALSLAAFDEAVRQFDGDKWVQAHRDRLAVIECEPDCDPGSHHQTVEAVEGFARKALDLGWRLWGTQTGSADPVVEIIDGKCGLLWKHCAEPLLLLLVPPHPQPESASKAKGKKLAQAVQITKRNDIAVGDFSATVLVAEGAAQLIWHAGGIAPLAGRSFLNDFIKPGMGDALRVLADAVDEASDLTSSL